jgi:hypothetical protein
LQYVKEDLFLHHIEAKELTVEQISEMLGFEIKIVK